VIHEVDLYKEFIPFVNASQVIDKVAHGELVAYLNVSMKLLSRDASIHAYGVDALLEHNLVVLIGGSIEEWPGFLLPFQPVGWTHNSINIKEFHCLIEIVAPNAAKTR